MNDVKAKPFATETHSMLFISFAILVLNILFYYFRFGGQQTVFTASTLFPVVCSLFAVGALVKITFYLKIWDLTKVAWLLLAIGFLFWFMEQSTYAFYKLALGRVPQVPSIADILWLCGVIPIFIALTLFIYGYHRTGFIIGSWLKYFFICLLISLLEIVLFYKLFMPVIYDPQINVSGKVFTLLYPAFDIFILMLAFFMVLITSILGKGILSKPWKFLVTGFVLIAVGDILYSYYKWTGNYQTGSYLDVTWNFGYLMIAVSAFYQKELMEKF